MALLTHRQAYRYFVECLEQRTLLSVSTFPSLLHNPDLGTIDASASIAHMAASLPATHLAFVKKPVFTIAGQVIGPELTVQVLDSANHLVAGDDSTVTIALVNAKGATLDGTTSVQVHNGVATFTDLSLTQAGPYMFMATDGALTAADSNTFTIRPDSASSHLVLIQQPGFILPGQPLAPALVVGVEDQFGNIVTTNHSQATLSIVSGPPGGTLGGTTTVTMNNGVATFSKATLSVMGAYTLAATDAGLSVKTPVQFTQTISQVAATLSAPNVTNTSGSTYTFSVTYSGNVGINVSALGPANVLVTGPNGFSQSATFVSVNNNANGTPRIATYQISVPRGSWDFTDDGTYSVAMIANQVSDASGNFVSAGTLGTFFVNDRDPTPPTAALNASDILSRGGSTYTFSVTYSDDAAINIATLDSTNIQVTGPNGFSQAATFVSVDSGANGTPRTATYQITAPGGLWEAPDNGVYAITINSNSVADTNGNFLPGGPLGTFSVSLSANTYYVSPAGDDSNAGTSLSPFQTIEQGVSVLLPGDTLNIESGTYAGFVDGWNFTVAGIPSAPITIQADPAAAPGSVVITSANPNTPDGIDFEPGCNFITVKGFAVDCDSSISRAGIRVGQSTGVQILNCTVNNAGTFGITTSFTTNCLIEGCAVTNTQGSGEAGHGIYVANSAVNPSVIGNTIDNNGGEGLHMNGDGSQGAPGVISGAVVEGNIIYDNAENGINSDGLVNSTIANNLVYNNGRQGIVLYRISAASNATNDIIMNNTVYQPHSSGAALQLVDGSTNMVVFNNILIGGSYGSINISDDSKPGLVSDDNVVSDTFRDDDTSTTMTFAAWQSGYGQDAHSIIADPSTLWVNPAGDGGYHLLAGSAAIDAGIGSLSGHPAPTVDLEGSPRPQGGNWDIGAYEFHSISTTPPVISQIVSTIPKNYTAVITWTTNELSTSSIQYGTTTDYGSASALDSSIVLSHSVTLTGLSPSTVYHYSVISTDVSGNVATSSDVTFTTPALDITPPALSGITPSAITASSAAITWTTDEASDSQVQFGTTTAYGSSTTLDPTLVTSHTVLVSGLAPFTTYHYRILSHDASGNLATSDDFAFTTPALSQAYTLFSNSTVPAVPDAADPSAVVLGMKFQSDIAGFITGIRFYKGPLNTGTHTGYLWNSTGTLLASARFTKETASGWQQVTFATPVAIAADTTYVAGYYAPNGEYAAQNDAFDAAGIDNGPLHILASGVSGSNGVFGNGAGTFPTQSFLNTNYFVDVLYSPAGVTTVAVPPPAASYALGQMINLSATFNAKKLKSAPFTGTATLADQTGQVLGTANLSANGAVKFALAGVAPGTYACTITYPGDANHTVLTSSSFMLLVKLAGTTTSLAASSNPLVFGQSLTLTATVNSSSGLNTPPPRTGSVSFYDGRILLGTAPLDGSSMATLPVTPTSVGIHRFKAVYSGDSFFKASTSPGLVRTVNKDKTSILLAPTPAGPILVNQTFNLNVQVALIAPGAGTLAGNSVTIKDNGKTLAALTLDGSGDASYPGLLYSSPGIHELTAIYAGDADTLAVVSSVLKLTIA